MDDIYQAAEHLILPPARRDVYLSSDQTSAVQYETGPLIQRQGSLAEDVEEIPIVEDFWGAVPDYWNEFNCKGKTNKKKRGNS